MPRRFSEAARHPRPLRRQQERCPLVGRSV